MKIAILANRAASYVRPMAEGLKRMLSSVDVEATIFYDGLDDLSGLPEAFDEYVRRNGNDPRRVARRAATYFLTEAARVRRFVRALRRFDVIVVVNTIPNAFLTSFFDDRTLRRLLPHIPIVLYDVFYLPTRGSWSRWLLEGKPERGVQPGHHWGLDRYDWYLCASVVSETPLPAGPNPYSLIGLDLDDGTLYPEEKSEFTVLIDFECTEYMAERAIQIQACEESGTKYVVLHGHYPIDQIRAIYRKTSAYLLAMRESFGLPICELQACGSYVFTPYTEWCPSHSLKSDLSRPGPGDLSPNFIVYGNDKNRLIEELRRIKAAYDPGAVVANFHEYHPQLFRGDEVALDDFITKVRSGQITSRSHRNYPPLHEIAGTASPESVRDAAIPGLHNISLRRTTA